MEYRKLLENADGDGLLQAGDAIFSANSITGWTFQQDGARAHTTGDTAAGRPTRAMIEAHATLLEPWPAHSPDMSPIEKAWAVCEAYLWAEESWHDLISFKAAVRRAWAAAVTPAYCARLFGGLRATYEAVVRAGGAEVRGWGRQCRQKYV